MAENSDDSEKTEEPSQYRLEESRRKGEVAYSRELNSVLLLSGTITVLVLCSMYMYEVLTEYLEWIYSLDSTKVYEKELSKIVINKTIIAGAKCVGPVFIASVLIGVLSQFMQVGFIYAPEAIQAKFERIDPINGFQRIFSKKALVEALKSSLKFLFVIIISYMVLKDYVPSLLGFLHSDLVESLGYGKMLIMKVSFSILLGLLVIALGDFAWEKWSYMQKMKMTKQEAKQEAKEKDGNPEIKQKIRQIQRQMASKRMSENVKKADVIVTNPTHISIAIRYDNKTMVAPEIVAKGADHIAMKIREIAKESDIPIVENVQLARTLYKTVKVGEGVPRTLYKAVAEVLAFVYKLRKKKKALG